MLDHPTEQQAGRQSRLALGEVAEEVLVLVVIVMVGMLVVSPAALVVAQVCLEALVAQASILVDEVVLVAVPVQVLGVETPQEAQLMLGKMVAPD